jgi:MOSC domain-containing protein YiiM
VEHHRPGFYFRVLETGEVAAAPLRRLPQAAALGQGPAAAYPRVAAVAEG